MSQRRVPAYKSVTLQQFRSFYETARRGSLTGAAAALGLAHPTVWKQVHALEQTFGTPLVETHVRGCRLTEAGQVLVSLIAPSVTNLDLDELRNRFAEALGKTEIHIRVAATPRLLAEDLPPCIAAFVSRWPRARFTLLEVNDDDCANIVEAGHADLGFTARGEGREHRRLLSFDPCYHLEVILVTPRDHPLARRRTIRPQDLKAFPLVDAWNALRDPQVHGLVAKLGLFETQPRHVEARQSGVLRRCVEAGLGIALVSGLPPRAPHPTLHERVMSKHFGRSIVYLVRRRGVQQHAAVNAFVKDVRTSLK